MTNKTYSFTRTINRRRVEVGSVTKNSDGTAWVEYVNWGGGFECATADEAFGKIRHALANADACNAWRD
jgi:hypothetical protein